jgi:hypothetical protein
MQTYEGRLDATGLRIVVVASWFNETITKSLFDGALSALRRQSLDHASIPEGAGVPPGITVAWVPGAFELPPAAKRQAASREFDAVVYLGAVIRGAPPTSSTWLATPPPAPPGPPSTRACPSSPSSSACLPPTASRSRRTLGARGGQQGLRLGGGCDRDGRPAAPTTEIPRRPGVAAVLRLALPRARSSGPPAPSSKTSTSPWPAPPTATTGPRSPASARSASSGPRRSPLRCPRPLRPRDHGRYWIEETGSDVVGLTQLHYSTATARPVHVVLAVSDDWAVKSGADPQAGTRIPIEFPELLRASRVRPRGGGPISWAPPSGSWSRWSGLWPGCWPSGTEIPHGPRVAAEHTQQNSRLPSTPSSAPTRPCSASTSPTWPGAALVWYEIVNRITVDPETAEGARMAFERRLEIAVRSEVADRPTRRRPV